MSTPIPPRRAAPCTVRRARPFLLLVLGLVGAIADLGAATASTTAGPADDLIRDRCLDCHDAETRKGGLDLEHLPRTFADPAVFARWVAVHDRVRAGEMPPEKEGRLDPATIAAAMDPLAKDLIAAETARVRVDGRARLRRLSRVELENSLRDLLALPGLKVAESLPEDGRVHGFDRLSEALDFSSVHLEYWLAAVDRALDQALCPLTEQPAVQKHRYQPWSESLIVGPVSRKEAIGLIGMRRDETFVAKYPEIIDEEPKATAVGLLRHQDSDHRYSLRQIGPTLSGWYRVRVSGYSFGWDGTQVVPTDRCGAISFGVFSRNESFGTVGLPANQPGEAEVVIWLERGGGLTHGLDDHLHLNPASCETLRGFPTKLVGPPTPGQGLALQWVEIEGPLNQQWPPASHRALFASLPVSVWTPEGGRPKPTQQRWPRGNPHTMPKDPYGERGEKRPLVEVVSSEPAHDAERLLRAFLRRAFRRPPTADEVASHVAMVRTAMSDGAAFQDAMLVAYRAALASPGFLLLRQSGPALDAHALAARLSYFLWSSMPDEELAGAADRDVLAKPGGLRAQAERMLADPKAQRFIADFTGQWLALREINATQPDAKLYPEFMPWLQESMLAESHAYFAELMAKDLGIAHLVRADFAMLNEPLARHYGIAGVSGYDLRRVPLPPGSHRGGFLTQGSVLKVTAAGTTTSPVKRGAFVLERLLGIVPTPPPPEAGAIEPDVRGATTVRAQLEQHRRNASCASCHAKMDPYGFALESFDVTGAWRDRYRATGGSDGDQTLVHGKPRQYHYALPVDASGSLADGRAFADVDGLRKLLAADPETLARAFVGHLITYATGAEVGFADRAVVDRIVARTKASGYGVRSLVLEVVQSPLFRSK